MTLPVRRAVIRPRFASIADTLREKFANKGIRLYENIYIDIDIYSWEQEMNEKPKLEVLRMIVDKDCKGRSAQIESKEVRRMVTKLRGGTAQLRIETGRWKGEGREERKCKECSGQEVEDAKHFLLKCARWQDEREELIERVKGTQRGGEFEAADDDEKLAMILDGACKDRGVGMAIRKMWKKRFV